MIAASVWQQQQTQFVRLSLNENMNNNGKAMKTACDSYDNIKE